MSATDLSDDEWSELYARFLGGARLIDLDRAHGFSNGVCSKMFQRRFGHTAHKKRPALTWDETDAIMDRIRAGESVSAIARSLQLGTNSALYGLLRKRYGYDTKTIRPRQSWTPTIDLSNASQPDLAYIAGLIDGEGSVMKVNRAQKLPTWILKIGMTDEAVMEWMHSWGGTLTDHDPKEQPRKHVWVWKMARQADVRIMLTAIEPYMIVKRSLALAALAELAAVPFINDKWFTSEPSESPA